MPQNVHFLTDFYENFMASRMNCGRYNYLKLINIITWKGMNIDATTVATFQLLLKINGIKITTILTSRKMVISQQIS